MALRLCEVDDLLRSDHLYLTEDDRCFFFREYTAYKGYDYSETNSLIKNFKKELDKEGTSQWKYKGKAINKIAEEFRESLKAEWFEKYTLVPIPPSKSKKDPLYDDRMVQVLKIFGQGLNLDIRELILQRESTPPFHQITPRPPWEYLVDNYYIDENIANPEPKKVILFDDLLTEGAHFKAAQNVLEKRYPGITTRGIFIARRVYADAEKI